MEEWKLVLGAYEFPTTQYTILNTPATLLLMLALKNVSKTFGAVTILQGATLQINPKDTVCIVGPSGSGKSTILRLLLRLDVPTKGTVLVDGVDLTVVPPPVLQLFRRRTGIIFQEPVLLAHATASENIALPLELAGLAEAAIRRAVEDLLQRLGLTAAANRFPDQLSLSERSLVAIARAIVTAPMVLIADEPFANLDVTQAKTVAALIGALRKNGTTVIALSRSDATATLLDARIIRLQRGAIAEESKPAAASDAGRHRILERPTASPASKEEETDDARGRKIRVTAIRSESVKDSA